MEDEQKQKLLAEIAKRAEELVRTCTLAGEAREAYEAAHGRMVQANQDSSNARVALDAAVGNLTQYLQGA